MATTHALVTLSNTATTKLTPNGLHSGMDVTIQNVDAAAYVYIGGVNVTTQSYGYRLMPNTAFSLELSGRDSLYAISDTNSSKVAVLKTNLEAGV